MKKHFAVIGGQKLRNKLRRFPEELTKEISEEIWTGAQKVLADAIAAVPVDTGDLRDAITAKQSNDKLGAKVGYSPKRSGFRKAWKRAGWRFHFVEFGTKKKPARPFLRPAFKKHNNEIALNVNAAVQRTLHKAATWKG